MMKSTTRFGSFVIGLLALPTIGSAAAPANGHCPPPLAWGLPPPSGERPPIGLPPGIRLSDDQQDKVFAIHHELAPVMRTKEKELQRGREALHQLSAGQEFDEEKVKAIAESVGRLTADVAMLRARTEQKIYRLLTAEQRQAMTAEGGRCQWPPVGRPPR